jgi:hypothetical protein
MSAVLAAILSNLIDECAYLSCVESFNFLSDVFCRVYMALATCHRLAEFIA